MSTMAYGNSRKKIDLSEVPSPVRTAFPYLKDIEQVKDLPKGKAYEVEMADYGPRKPDTVALGLATTLRQKNLHDKFRVAMRTAGGTKHIFIIRREPEGTAQKK